SAATKAPATTRRHGWCCGSAHHGEEPTARNNSYGESHVGFLFVLAVGLVAGTISGIVGTGSSIMLMPVLVYQYGPKQAVPIMAVAPSWPTCRASSRGGARSTGAPAPPIRSPVFQPRHSARA